MMEVCRIILATGLMQCGQPMDDRSATQMVEPRHTTPLAGYSAPFTVQLPPGYSPPYPDRDQFAEQPTEWHVPDYPARTSQPGNFTLHQGQSVTCQ